MKKADGNMCPDVADFESWTLGMTVQYVNKD
jgi:hypothetical protein